MNDNQGRRRQIGAFVQTPSTWTLRHGAHLPEPGSEVELDSVVHAQTANTSGN